MTQTDGRNIDPRIGNLSGEGSHQDVTRSAIAPFQPPPGTGPSYYDRPVLKKSPWSWTIPAYYYVGGATGASMALGAAAIILDRDELSGLIRKARWIGLTGATISGGLLIHDLGRPSRFLNMLRVFRPTSPMSMGTWILTSFSSAAGLCIISEFMHNEVLGNTSTVVAGVLGLALSGYTGVLVANTAVPLWQRPHRLLPALFLSSAAASAASLFDVLGNTDREQSAVRAFGTMGRVADLALSELVERHVATVPEAARPFREGFSGFVWKSARFLTAASLVVSLVAGRNRKLNRLSGILGTLGGLCTRFGIHYAGQASAMNPRATFRQQRGGEGAYEVTGKSAITGPGGERAYLPDSPGPGVNIKPVGAHKPE